MSFDVEASRAPAVRHRLIIRHERQGAVAIVTDTHTGELRLPAVVADDHHTAEVACINAAVAQAFSLRTTVLRSLSHGEPIDGIVDRSHELELHGEGSTLPANLRWCAPVDLAVLPDPEDQRVFGLWSGTRESNDGVFDGRAWTRPGWFDVACSWIEHVMRASKLPAPLEIRQLRTWASSCVLQVATQTGDYYFKALPRSGGVEWAVTNYLADHFVDTLPHIVAVQPEHGWLLMAACTGRSLEQITDVALWERAASQYARLQVACIGRVDALKQLGCPVRDLDALAQSIESLAGDVDALRPGEVGGLTRAECERFSRVAPLLRRRCRALAAYGMPSTIEHGDLWPGNIFVDAESCVVIDWEDAAIAPPFFSLAPLQVGLINAGLGTRANVERLERAYLAGFVHLGSPADLQRALRLAIPLCFIEMAARYRGQPRSVVSLHPWMRDLVPQTVRLALSRIQDGDLLDHGVLDQTT